MVPNEENSKESLSRCFPTSNPLAISVFEKAGGKLAPLDRLSEPTNGELISAGVNADDLKQVDYAMQVEVLGEFDRTVLVLTPYAAYIVNFDKFGGRAKRYEDEATLDEAWLELFGVGWWSMVPRAYIIDRKFEDKDAPKEENEFITPP